MRQQESKFRRYCKFTEDKPEKDERKYGKIDQIVNLIKLRRKRKALNDDSITEI